MKGIRDWVFSQLLAPSLVSSRPVSVDSFVDEEPVAEVFNRLGSSQGANVVSQPESADLSGSYSNNPDTPHESLSQQVQVEDSNQSHGCSNIKRLDPLTKIEDLQINFLRLLRRLGQTNDNLVVAKVLYRLHLATLISSGESDLQRANLSIDRAKALAANQEAAGSPELDFSMRILVLGKTGVGKSATINSIFDQMKSTTDAFRPSTDCIQEVVGSVNGVRITVIDTPGLLAPSLNNLRRNRKILHSVKRFIKKFPPDIVLYFERLDLINMGYSDLPLLKLITDVFGSGIWFNTILVMTHSSSALPEGANGYAVSYDYHVSKCADLVQHCMHQAVSDSRLENPILLVENHPQCKTNFQGEKILPNGQAWKSQFLLLSACTKVLSDANTLLKFQTGFGLGSPSVARMPSLPHLLSSFLERHPLSNFNGPGYDIEDILSSDVEDDYEQLPPIRILTKSQFQKLTNSQKNDYLDELDYRETVYMKKQLKEELQRRRKSELAKEKILTGDDDSYKQDLSPEAVLLPDMAVPSSFDSDCPLHRYRCLVTTDQWLVRPVLDPHGWDHDVSFDGINLEGATNIKKNVDVSVSGQISKDKCDFSLQSEYAAAYTSSRGPSYCVGLDVQSAGRDFVYTVHSSAKHRNFIHNNTECGLSVTSFGDKYYFGAKLEDVISIGKRLEFVMNVGQMAGGKQVAHGGCVKATLKGRDYPVRNDALSLAMTILSYNKELVLGGSFQSDFRPTRGTKMSVNANLNSRKLGQISVKTSSSEHLEIAFLALYPIIRALLSRIAARDLSSGSVESG